MLRYLSHLLSRRAHEVPSHLPNLLYHDCLINSTAYSRQCWSKKCITIDRRMVRKMHFGQSKASCLSRPKTNWSNLANTWRQGGIDQHWSWCAQVPMFCLTKRRSAFCSPDTKTILLHPGLKRDILHHTLTFHQI